MVASGPPAEPSKVSPYTKWLEEDVVYIITNEERQRSWVWKPMRSAANFIEQFWLRRDPTPGTPENEFKEEHYRRIAKANCISNRTRQGRLENRSRAHLHCVRPAG